MAKLKFQFKGMENIMKTINDMGLDIHDAAEEALEKSYDLVTNQVKSELTRYKTNTGSMEESFYKSEKVQWIGETARVKAGFDWRESMHSTYMMITGTPHREPDKKLYNAIYGTSTNKEIKKIQEETLMKVIEGGY